VRCSGRDTRARRRGSSSQHELTSIGGQCELPSNQ
jgi:hypothetical protein